MIHAVTVRDVASVLLRATVTAAVVVAGAACGAAPPILHAGGSLPPPASSAPAAPRSPTPAPVPTAQFDAQSAGGRVTRIVMRPAGSPDYYVFDGFVETSAALAVEQKRMVARSPRPAFCAASQDDQATCEKACGWIQPVRPFTRVTLQTAAGRSQLLTSPGDTRLRFNAGGREQGDCLSPDGRYLSVFAEIDDDAPAGARAMIVELVPGLPAARFVGQRSGRTYGEDRYFDFAGWDAGHPHALLFSWGGDDGSGEQPSDAPELALPR